jgi:S-adenosylmethionine:tRNA ribosyltransferase-isomerase
VPFHPVSPHAPRPGADPLLDYALPPGLIAQHPAARREDARLLVVERASGALQDARVSGIGAWLRPGDTLALNETRVLPARLHVRRPTGGRVELLFVRPLGGPDPAGVSWRVLARPARGAAPGLRLASAGGLVVEVTGSGAGGERDVRVVAGDLGRAMRDEGEVPLPPYIERAPEPADRERYQTVYARIDGAVAAPTAGLHFSAALLDELAAQGVRQARVLLHVGPGTFRPLGPGDPAAHVMDAEWFEVPDEAARTLTEARVSGGRIVAVGTTAVRALESACDANSGSLGAAHGWTTRYIRPGDTFRAVDALLTNFHLPRTTLLLLVAAFAGEELTRRAYAHAIAGRYRFYSYGDAMLIV